MRGGVLNSTPPTTVTEQGPGLRSDTLPYPFTKETPWPGRRAPVPVHSAYLPTGRHCGSAYCGVTGTNASTATTPTPRSAELARTKSITSSMATITPRVTSSPCALPTTRPSRLVKESKLVRPRELQHGLLNNILQNESQISLRDLGGQSTPGGRPPSPPDTKPGRHSSSRYVTSDRSQGVAFSYSQ
jgi:hypothetical protein